jgi:hypothetical protein
MHVWIHLPLKSGSEEDVIWEWWHGVRTMCEHNSQLGICLKVGGDAEAPLPLDVSRWHAEPVQCLNVPMDTFVYNRRGFPVLRPEHKALVSSALRFGVQVPTPAFPEL